MDSPVEREQGKHLSDTDIGKILGLAKALMSQQEIAELMKCIKKIVETILLTYHFETFQTHNSWPKYAQKTTEQKDRYILCALKQNEWMPSSDITHYYMMSSDRSGS